MKVILGITIVFITLVAIGFVAEKLENQTPVRNTSTSFCIVKDGKPYYFAIEGWELPTLGEVENTMKVRGLRARGLYVWLKVRTNLPLEIDADENGYVLIGEQYKPILSAEPDLTIKRDKDVLLIAYDFPPGREDIESLLKANSLRLYFDVDGYYDVLPTSGCINEICFTVGHHGPGFYINFTPPPTILKALDIEGRCVKKELCLYNVTFELKEGYLFLDFCYDEATGRKSQTLFPLHINVYVEKNGKLLPTNEYFLYTVVPPLPPSAYDIWKEPEHEYLTTVIPPGIFTLALEAHGAIYPMPLFKNTPIALGTPWGVAKFEPKLEVVEIVGINGTAYDDRVVIEEVNVMLRNSGRIPIVIPQAYTSYDVPPNYMMLKGVIDSTKLIFISQEANNRWDLGRWLVWATVINPGETATVSLTPITLEELFEEIDPNLEPLELPLEVLNHSHMIAIESIYTNTTSSIIIPPLRAELSVLNITRMHTEWSFVESNIKLLISNTWVLPISTDWIKLYPDNEPLSEYIHYFVPREEIAPNSSMTVDIEVLLDKYELDEVFALYEHLRLSFGLTHLDIPLADFVYELGEEVVLGDLAVRILSITTVDAIGVQRYSYLEDRTVVDYYKAPEGYSIFVAYIEVKNNGIKTILLDSVDIDNSVVITRRAVFELTRLSELVYTKNAISDIIVDSEHLWENLDSLILRPGESCVITLLFLAPKDAEVLYIVFDYCPYIAVFAVQS